jgi:hypothetical protein
MNPLLIDLLEDEAGFLLSAELVVVATVLVLGMTTALVAVRDSVTAELTDVANSIRSLDQSYYYSGIRGCAKGTIFASWTPGSASNDAYLRTSGPVQEFCGQDLVLGPGGALPEGAKPFCSPLPVPITPPPGYSQPGSFQQGQILHGPILGGPSLGVPQGTYYPQSETVLPVQSPCPSTAPCGQKARPEAQLPKAPQGPLQVW